MRLVKKDAACCSVFFLFQAAEQFFPLWGKLAEVGFQNDVRRNAGMRDAVQPREFLFKVQDGAEGGVVVFQIGVCPLQEVVEFRDGRVRLQHLEKQAREVACRAEPEVAFPEGQAGGEQVRGSQGVQVSRFCLRPLHAALVEEVQAPGKGAVGLSGAFGRRSDDAFLRAPYDNQAVLSQGSLHFIIVRLRSLIILKNPNSRNLLKIWFR